MSKIYKLTEVVNFIGGSQPPKSVFSDIKKDGYVRLIQIRDYKSDNYIVYINEDSTKKFCTEDDIMIGRYGPPVFQILRGISGAYNVALMKAEPKIDEVSKEYLFRFLQNPSIQNYIIGLSQRSAGQSGVNKEALEQYEILLPSLIEQQRIVSKLDLLFEKIDKSIALHQKNMDEANAFMGSVLNDVFGELEEKYEKTIIKNILKIAQYGFSTKSSDNGKYPFLRMGDLQNGKILLNNLKYVNLSDKEFLKYKLEKYDILFNRTNSFELVGKTSIFEESIDMSFASYLVRLRVDDNKAYPYYLNYYLNAEKTQSLLKEMATKAVNQSNINAQKLQSILIPLPPLNIQQKVVKYLDEITQKIEKIKQAQKDKMNSLKALKASILDQAFKGEL